MNKADQAAYGRIGGTVSRRREGHGVDVAFQPSESDIADFQAQMARLTGELKKSPQEACKMGTIALLKALQTSTKTSPGFRKLKPMDKADRFGVRSYAIDWDHDVSEKKREWAVPMLRGAKPENHPLGKIHYQGTAKASWGWAMWGLFQQGRPAYRGRRLHKKTVDLRKYAGDGHYEVHVENFVSYINSAFHGGQSARKPSVDSAMARATAVMRGRIDQRLKGKLK